MTLVHDFFASTVDDWDDPQGMLHAYLVPDGSALERFLGALSCMATIEYVSAQPPSALHATVLRTAKLVRNLTPESVGMLARMPSARDGFPDSLTLEFGRPEPSGDAVICQAPPNACWKEVVGLADTIARTALGDDSLPYRPPRVPHITVAYATDDGPDSAIIEALRGSGPIGPLRFQRIDWCAVYQNRREGTYTFDTITSSHFGRR